jgi:4-hydroxythreonine-4-phosphate dehydrogenase
VKRPLRIAITTGDADGIGTEIAAKALARLKPSPGVHFLLWRSPRCPRRDLALIDKAFKRITVSSWHEALGAPVESHKQIVDINSNLPPPIWVETTAKASHFGHVDAMVTAPISKTSIRAAGLADLGHTDILRRVAKTPDLFMGFIGDKFNVLLATAHIPLAEVSGRLTASCICSALAEANRMRGLLDKRRAKRPLALLGLNPHAGEDGLIGPEEGRAHREALIVARSGGLEVDGPLVPDAAFFEENWRKYSVFIANYHDQGLIPFKMTHGQRSGVHITMGLPFVRTSVDHGTAKNIFGKNKADASSMTLAIEWAARLARIAASPGKLAEPAY